MGDESLQAELESAEDAQYGRDVFARFMRVAAPLSVSEWAEAHMVIPKDTGAAEPGPYRLSRTPYAREPLDCLSETHPCSRVVVRAASQMLKTQVGLCFFGQVVHQAPSNLLVMLPTDRLMKRISSRISATVAAVPVLRDLVAEPRSRDARNTIDTKQYPGGSVYIVTAGSAANLAEIPARYLWGDEIDQWEVNVNGEGDPIALAEKRQNTFTQNKKSYWCSSPRQKALSKVDRLIEASTDKVYDVPCPHCGDMHELVWQNMRWNEATTRAWMVCPACGGEIEERHKIGMLDLGRWRARRAGDGKTEGFTISALYMPIGWSSWLDLVREYLEAQAKLAAGEDELLRTFTNTRLAESFETSGTKINAEVLKERAERLPQRKVPDWAYVVTAAADLQDDRIEYLAVAWGPGEESVVVDYGKIFGDPAQDEVWKQLDDWRARTFTHATGVELPLAALAIDTGGHHTHRAYGYCRTRESERVFAIKGSDDVQMPIKGPAKLMDINLEGKILKHGVRLWRVGTHNAKDLWAGRLKLEGPGPGFLHFPDYLDQAFYDGLMAEERTLVKTSRGTVFRWIKPLRQTRNEPWDLLVYNSFAAHTLDMNTWSAEDWKWREDRIRNDAAAPDAVFSLEVGALKRFQR